MEGLLGVDTDLGNLGGGENSSGSSSWNSSSDWHCSSGYSIITQFLFGNESDGFSIGGSSDSISGINLRTGEWCNFLSEILEESTGKGDVAS